MFSAKTAGFKISLVIPPADVVFIFILFYQTIPEIKLYCFI
jgi:hypothetical protein